MIVLRQKEYAFMPGLMNVGKSMVTSFGSGLYNNINKAKTIINNPGKAVNNGIANTIRHPAKTVTNLVVDQGLGSALNTVTGGATSILPVIPGSSSIGSSLGNKVQKVLDGNKKSAALLRSIKADKFSKSPLAGKIETGVNNTLMNLSSIGQSMGF